MKSLVLLLLSGCGGLLAPYEPPCEPPAAFVSCDVAELGGTPRCWADDTTDWLLYPDGSYVHENRVACSAGVASTILCRGRIE